MNHFVIINLSAHERQQGDMSVQNENDKPMGGDEWRTVAEAGTWLRHSVANLSDTYALAKSEQLMRNFEQSQCSNSSVTTDDDDRKIKTNDDAQP